MLHVASSRTGVFRASTNIACVAGEIVVPGVTFLAVELPHEARAATQKGIFASH